MPRTLQIGLTTLGGALLLGAGYLVAVRGEAILADMAALGSRVWCF
jgi:hypothetical protein